MFETVINLKPKEEWRPGVTIESLTAEMDKALQFPGVSNAWTMPIKARIDMLATGIRTPVGIKVLGKDLTEWTCRAPDRNRGPQCPRHDQRLCRARHRRLLPRYRAGPRCAARYGLMIGNLQDTIAMALGGETVTTTVEGRERYTVNVRYPRDFASDPAGHSARCAGAAAGRRNRAARRGREGRATRGPTSIRTENGQLAVYIYVDMQGRDLGSYVADAQKAVADNVKLPAGTYLQWSGQFEYMQRAIAKLKIVVPLTLSSSSCCSTSISDA